MSNLKKFCCINCGKEVISLYKKYSPTVLKLTDCENCNNVADKYIEYDTVIVIIDLVLLHKGAYRHILHNIDFKNFWKLAVLLLLMETYSDWVLKFPKHEKNAEYKLFLNEVDMTDFEFYKIYFKVILRTIVYVITAYLLTLIRGKFVNQQLSFMMVWKTLTISNFGLFLLLPSLIWDNSVQEFHMGIVVLYTTLSQLLAYTAVCSCTKICSIIIIFISYYCKSQVIDVCDFFQPFIEQILLM